MKFHDLPSFDDVFMKGVIVNEFRQHDGSWFFMDRANKINNIFLVESIPWKCF